MFRKTKQLEGLGMNGGALKSGQWLEGQRIPSLLLQNRNKNQKLILQAPLTERPTFNTIAREAHISCLISPVRNS
jgi:hypothetical protein